MNNYEKLVSELKHLKKEYEFLSYKKRKLEKENESLKKELKILKLKNKKNSD